MCDKEVIEHRREALEKFASANPDVPQGFRWGLSDRVLIGRFRDPDFVRGLQQTLRNSDIRSTLKTSRFEAAVYVPELNRDDAFHILSEFRESFPSQRQERKFARRYDLYFAFGLVSLISTTLLGIYFVSLPLWFATLAACFVMGWECDRLQISRRWHGRYLFTSLDLLAVFVVVAMILAALNFQRP